MVVYGSKAVHVKTEQLKMISCPNCETQGSLTVSVFSRHAHIFWIPIFPFGKTGASECSNCKQVLKPKEMPERVRQEYNRIKGESKTPIWQFSGLVLIATLIIWLVNAGKEDKRNELVFISNPLVGDVYEYKTEGNNYSTLKVTQINGDSVYVSPNDYEITKKRGMYKIDKDENYPDYSYGIAKSELQKMYDEGDIYDINRK